MNEIRDITDPHVIAAVWLIAGAIVTAVGLWIWLMVEKRLK